MSTHLKTLWTIGKPDGSAADLALKATDFVKYPHAFPLGPVYIVGRSEPRRDWPHVHPGPLDDWAGSRPHAFTVRFGLAARPAQDARLVLWILDTNRPKPPRLRIQVNDYAKEYALPGGSHYMLEGRASEGSPHALTVPIPASSLRAGENVLTITNTAGCWLVYDALAFEGSPELALTPVRRETEIRRTRPLAALLRGGESRTHTQLVELVVYHTGQTVEAEVEAGDIRSRQTLPTGCHPLVIPVPAVEETKEVPVRIRHEGHVLAEASITLVPVRPWVVYLLHHTHLDIGYTHVQSEVLERQVQHLRRALELIDRTKDYPPEARFRWNPEGLWAVEAFLKEADEGEREAFLKAVREGSIGLDALFANILTGLSRPETLFEHLRWAVQLRAEYGLAIDSAMITDIPGYSWGLVPVLAQSGVKYLSLAPNRAHRIGHTLAAWGDRAFFWRSACGQHQVLCWMAGEGYSWFHGPARSTEVFGKRTLTSSLDGRRLLAYLSRLEAAGYPYDYVQLRYNIDTDNGPPDPGLSDFVRAWNEKYVSPRLVLTTAHAMLADFERRYGDQLPTVQGDFTPYWEDGVASSARETAQSRAAADRLLQAETLWTLLRPDRFPVEDFAEAWRQVVLFDEHTWGAWNSISEPESALARSQWEVKRGFAVEAERRSRALLHQAGDDLMPSGDTVSRFAVFNTSSWPRSEVVYLPRSWRLAGERVTTADGKPVMSQRLSSGELAVRVEHVPPMAAAVFHLSPGPAWSQGTVEVSGTRLVNGRLSVEVDPGRGGIGSLRSLESGVEWVEGNAPGGLGEYLYVAGRDPASAEPDRLERVEVVEAGPLVAAIRAESRAPGCRGLARVVRLGAGSDHVELLVELDKLAVYEPEAAYLAFPFAVARPQVRIDVAWGIVRPEQDQLPGACRNYFTAQHWVDVSNEQGGVTLALLDAPLVEIGAITTDATVVGWRERAENASRLYSYIMNNYWETNYLAAQEGPVTLRYALRPHGPFEASATKRFGLERSQPLIPVPLSEQADPPTRSRLTVTPPDVLISRLKPADDGQGLLVRLFNASDRAHRAELQWAQPPARMWLSGPRGEKGSLVDGPIEIQAWGLVTLRCEG